MYFLKEMCCCFKSCKTKNKLTNHIYEVKKVSKVIFKQMDLQKLLIQIQNCDLNLSRVLEKMDLKRTDFNEKTILTK